MSAGPLGVALAAALVGNFSLCQGQAGNAELLLAGVHVRHYGGVPTDGPGPGAGGRPSVSWRRVGRPR